jgi:cyclophilin family peptidyl-prolyl cis-trans isomerase
MKLRPVILPLLFAAALTSVHAEDMVVLRLEKKSGPLPPVVIELFEADAPKHSANFKKLVSKGFYKNTTIHRVIPGALVQMGDPLSRQKDSPDLGTGGPGYTLAPEIKRKHTAGVVGMGRLPDQINPGRLSNGSQFYVTLKALPELDGTQTVFGRVTQGLETLEEISNRGLDTNSAPVDRVMLGKCKVVPRERLSDELSQGNKKTPSGGGFWNRWFGGIIRLF